MAKMLADAFTLGSILLRTVAISQLPKLSHQLNDEVSRAITDAFRMIRIISTKLGIEDISKTIAQFSSYDEFINSSLIHKIEASLENNFGFETRAAFSLGNFLCISSMAQSREQLQTTLGHAEICAHSLHLKPVYIAKLFANLRTISPNSREPQQEFLRHIQSLHDELDKLESIQIAKRPKTKNRQIIAAVIGAIAAIIAALS